MLNAKLWWATNSSPARLTTEMTIGYAVTYMITYKARLWNTQDNLNLHVTRNQII